VCMCACVCECVSVCVRACAVCVCVCVLFHCKYHSKCEKTAQHHIGIGSTVMNQGFFAEIHDSFAELHAFLSVNRIADVEEMSTLPYGTHTHTHTHTQ